MSGRRNLIVMFAACAAALAVAVPAQAKGERSSRAAKLEQIERFEKRLNKLESTLWYWHNNPDRRWMLHLRYKHLPCWKVPLRGPERLCALARGSVRVSLKQAREIEEKIARLEAELLPVGIEAHWDCIQGHETGPPFPAWRTNTGNGYFGGLQMNRSFMGTYGADMVRKYGGKIVYILIKDVPRPFAYGGEAHLWAEREQKAVAERARASGRGYHPWPTTARMCGLI